MIIRKGPKYGEKFNNAWQGSIEIIRDIASLFGLELRLAGKNLVIIAVLIIFTGIFLLTIWFSISFIILAWLMSYGFSTLAGLSVLILLNLFLMIVSGIIIYFRARNVSFKETRHEVHLLMEDKNE